MNAHSTRLRRRAFFAGLLAMTTLQAPAEPATPPGRPAWLNARIASYEKAPMGGMPNEIWTYTLRGARVYYVRAACCGQVDELLDTRGRAVCVAEGGAAQAGTPPCSAVHFATDHMQLLWQDPRLGMQEPARPEQR